MPFLAMSVFFMLGTVGIASELTRMFETVRELEFSAQAAALYGCSLSTNSDGSYSMAAAQTNITNAVLLAGTNAWNIAECGPTGNVFSPGTGRLVWSKPVSFASSDIQFVYNALDNNEFFTQVTARRQNNDALQQVFLPLFWLYSNPVGTKLSSNQFIASTYQTTEVIGQPASRIGAGAPLTATAGSTASNYIGWAALPIAISNQEFAAIASPSQTTTTYTIDLVSPNTTGTVQSGHIRGCLVNLATGSTSNNYYGSGTGNTAVSQLISLLNYFAGGQQSLAPTIVEQGSQLSAFDPTNSSFTSRQSQINQALSNLPNKTYILPVLAGDPVFGSSNTVVGFARFILASVNITGGTVSSLTMDIGESVPVYNTSCMAGFSAIPGNTSTLLPTPVAPFLPRQYDSNSGGITLRQRGVVLAPAISPRQITSS